MLHFVVLALASLVVSPAPTAQTFPAPGTGVFTWRRVGDRPLDAEGFAFAPDGRLYAVTDTVYVFEPAQGGPPNGYWRRLGYPRLTLNAVLALDAGGDTLFVGRSTRIHRSVDGGATWAIVNEGGSTGGGGPDSPDGFLALPPDHPHAGRLLAGGTILRSDDRGATWTEATRIAPFPGDGGYAHVFAALPSGRVLIAGNWGVAASDDGGASVAVTPIWGDFRFLVDGLVAVATPGSVQTGAPACGLPDTTQCDGAVAIGIDATGPDVRAWWTNDGGRSWSAPVRLPEPQDGVANGYTAGVVALSPGADGLGRAITVLGRGVVYATDDGGQTWEAVGRLPTGSIGHSTRLVRLGPDGHLWVTTTINGSSRQWMWSSAEPAEAAFVVASSPAPPIASTLAEVSVRPNPSAGEAVVVVSLARPAEVTAEVTDALGRVVATLGGGAWPAGSREIAVPARLAAGTYRVRVVAVEPGAGPVTFVRLLTVAR